MKPEFPVAADWRHSKGRSTASGMSNPDKSNVVRTIAHIAAESSASTTHRRIRHFYGCSRLPAAGKYQAPNF
jgi:hypothetical protein